LSAIWNAFGIVLKPFGKPMRVLLCQSSRRRPEIDA
jgi:hypothetical protein